MIKVGDKIKLNPELVTDKTILSNPDATFGSLNYLVAFLDFELEVVNVFNDSYQGDMVDCKVLNGDYPGYFCFKLKDLILLHKDKTMFKVKRRELFKQALALTKPVTLHQVLETLEISLDEYLTMSHQEYVDMLFSYVHNRQGYVAS